MKLSLLDFNTQGTPFFAPDIHYRYKKFSEIIAKKNPDVICLQEIVTYYHLVLLKKYLPYPFFIYNKALQGPKGGLVIVSKVPFENVTYKRFTTLGSLRDISRMSRIVQNGILQGTLKDHATIIVNTHTFSDFEFEWSPTNRLYRYVKSHVEQIAQEIDTLTANKKSVILAGDFNMKKNSRLYKYLIEKTRVIDALRQDSFPTYYKERLDYKFKGKTSERIDFIFIKDERKKIKILSHEYLFEKEEKLANNKVSYLSDHIGIKVNFDIV